MGPKVAAASAATQVPVATQFATGIEAAMSDTQAGANDIWEQLRREGEARKQSIKEQVAQHLGPDSQTASQSYISGLARGGNTGRVRFEDDIATDPQQQKPPLEQEQRQYKETAARSM